MPDRKLTLAAASRSGWQRDKILVKLYGCGNDGDLIYRKARKRLAVTAWDRSGCGNEQQGKCDAVILTRREILVGFVGQREG